jgi:hypothetical protein
MWVIVSRGMVVESGDAYRDPAKTIDVKHRAR